MKLLHLLFTSTLVSTLSLTALGAVQRDLSFLPSAKEKTLDRRCGKPYDYEVEYLESNTAKNQWIDTGVLAGNVYGFNLGIEGTGISSYGGYVAAGTDGAKDFCVQIHNASINTIVTTIKPVGGVKEQIVLNLTSGIKNAISFDFYSHNFSLNGEVVRTISCTESCVYEGSTTRIYLFKGYRTPTGRIYYLTFTGRDGSLLLDLIPVVATFNGVQEACFYNRAFTADGTHGLQFYRNAGTDAFTVGPRTGDVCKVGMGKKDVPDNNVPPLQMAMPPPVTTVVSTNMTNTVASVTKGN